MHNTATSGRVGVDEAGGILTLTLENPAAGHEITASMFDILIATLAAQATTPTARVLRLRAEGPAFCTGRERAGRDAASIHAEVTRLIGFKKALRASPLVSIAEVQGDAHGFGLGIAMLCDFTLVSTAATLAFPEMRKGLPPAAIMAYLGRYGSPKTTFPLVLFGELFTPEKALAAGLISEVLAPEALAARSAAIADRILAMDADGVRNCKSYFQAAEEGTLAQNFQLATETLVVNSLRLMDAARK